MGSDEKKANLRADAPIFKPNISNFAPNNREAHQGNSQGPENEPTNTSNYNDTSKKSKKNKRSNQRRRKPSNSTGSRFKNKQHEVKTKGQQSKGRKKEPHRRRPKKHNSRNVENTRVGKTAEVEEPVNSNEPNAAMEQVNFPSLLAARPPPTTTEVKGAWSSDNAPARKLQSLQNPLQSDTVGVKAADLDFFDRMGLQRLESNRMANAGAITSQVETGPRNAGHHNPRVTRAELLQTDETSSITSTIADLDENQRHAAGQARSRRTKWNIEKLRDKWWSLVSKQNVKLRFMADLRSTIAKNFVPAEDFGRAKESESQEDQRGPSKSGVVENDIISERSSLLTTLQDEYSESTEGPPLLVKIVRRNDIPSLEEFLGLHEPHTHLIRRVSHTECQEALSLAVERHYTEILSILLHFINESERGMYTGIELASQKSSDILAPAFFQALEAGEEEIISIFLTKWNNTTTLLAWKDARGNNALHSCCERNCGSNVLVSLLKSLTVKTKSKQQQLSKLMLARNLKTQTPFHIACGLGRNSVVQTILKTCSTSLLAKLMASQDNRFQSPLLAAIAANQGDVVMTLIMWRGNNNSLPRQLSHIYRSAKPRGDDSSLEQDPPCPLVWASQSGLPEMIHILLQFGESLEERYRINEALLALIQSHVSVEDKIEASGLLIENGASPFTSVQVFDASQTSETGISLAARLFQTNLLTNLVSSGKQILLARQLQRRRDPKLQQQPASFFSSLETKENSEMQRALADALVEALFRGSSRSILSHHEQPFSALHPALVLYDSGVFLNEQNLARLQNSLIASSLQPPRYAEGSIASACYVTKYEAPETDGARASTWLDMERDSLSASSSLMCGLKWFKEFQGYSTTCQWVNEARYAHRRHDADVSAGGTVVLITSDEAPFLIHESIVAPKSHKLASAIRFSRMQEDVESDDKIEISTTMSFANCNKMMQHIYHGSVFSGWSENDEELCSELLELMIVAEEFLCPTLIQECEMRLLSSEPRSCFCWSCAKCIRPRNITRAECCCFVSGPSKLIRGTNALDILALLEEIVGSELHYTILQWHGDPHTLACMNPTRMWKALEGADCGPLRLAYQAVLGKLFREFATILMSKALEEYSTLDGEVDRRAKKTDMMYQASMLLQLCLEKIASSPIIKPLEVMSVP